MLEQLTMAELELIHKLVDDWLERSADPVRVDTLRDKIQDIICLRMLGAEEARA